MNKIQRLQYEYPKIWLIISFLPFLFATFILFPISCIFDFFCELPRILVNFWRDFSSSCQYIWKDNIDIIKSMWKIWIGTF